MENMTPLNSASSFYGSLMDATAYETPLTSEHNKKSTCVSQFKQKEFYLKLFCRAFAEFLGTALYVFAGVTSLSNFIGNEHPHLPTVALTFGFSFAGLSASMQHISGGHLNPAITVGVFIAGGINVLAAVAYIVAQIMGGVIGTSFVMVYQSALSHSQNLTLDNEDSRILDYAATVVLDGIKPEMAMLVEMMLTLMLVTVFIHTSMEKNGTLLSTSPALSGLTLAAGILSGYKITGGSLNPARSFGPVAVSGNARLWHDHYVYWIGPLVGGAISGTLHRVLLSSRAIVFHRKCPCTKQTRGSSINGDSYNKLTALQD